MEPTSKRPCPDGLWSAVCKTWNLLWEKRKRLQEPDGRKLGNGRDRKRSNRDQKVCPDIAGYARPNW